MVSELSWENQTGNPSLPEHESWNNEDCASARWPQQSDICRISTPELMSLHYRPSLPSDDTEPFPPVQGISTARKKRLAGLVVVSPFTWSKPLVAMTGLVTSNH